MTPVVTSASYAALIVVAYCLLCWVCWWRYRQRQIAPVGANGDSDLLVIFASQSGRAAELAQQTAQQLAAGGRAPRLLPMNQLKDADLQCAQYALLVASTYGEGDPPDMGAGFAHRYLRQGSGKGIGHRLDLSHLHYGVLALGERSYSHFCAFGHRLDRGFRRWRAQPLFDLIEMDGEDAAALARWQQALTSLTGAQPSGEHSGFGLHQPQYHPARLLQRYCLNPQGVGAPAFHLVLASDQCPAWQAGDIAAVRPRNDSQRVEQLLELLQLDGTNPVTQQDTDKSLAAALQELLLPDDTGPLFGLAPQALVDHLKPIPSRDYSIASTTHQGQLELLVRQMRYPDGRLGLGSGWLTEWARTGEVVEVHVRSNPAFHAPEAQRPLILIGNGTGIAGLRAHLLAREQQRSRPNWLLFGERSRDTDLFFAGDLQRWHNSGHLARLDLAFSREPGGPRYVQDLLPPAADELCRWIDDGAAIYVCGSREGMASGVEQALVQLLGSARLEHLRQSGCYRRDVY